MTPENNSADIEIKKIAEEVGSAICERLWDRLSQNHPTIAPEYLSPKQVSVLTGIPIKSLEAMRGVRSGPPYFKVGERVRYRVEDVRSFIEREGPVT